MTAEEDSNLLPGPSDPEHAETQMDSPERVTNACINILKNDLGMDLEHPDVVEALAMIAESSDYEVALTTAITTFEGLGLPYEGLFELLEADGVIEASRTFDPETDA